MLNLLKSKIIPAAFIALTTIVPAHATVLNISDDGQLLGASNVEVNGTLFDVSFASGNCFEIFSGCDEVADFAFNNIDDAQDAANILLDSVFIDEFENDLDRIFEGSSQLRSGDEFIFTIIPFQVDPINEGFFISNFTTQSNEIDSATGLTEFNESIVQLPSNSVDGEASFGAFFAVFSEVELSDDTTIDVPSPATFGLFTLGLLVLGLRRKLNQ